MISHQMYKVPMFVKLNDLVKKSYVNQKKESELLSKDDARRNRCGKGCKKGGP